MKYPPSIKSCQEAIRKEWCTGCQALEEPSFIGNSNCEGSFPPKTIKAKEHINKIHQIFGEQERIEL